MHPILRLCPALLLAAGLAGGASAEPALPPPPATVEQSPAPAADQDLAQEFCANVADAAADARFAWQAKELADLERQLEERIAQLNAKQAEYESWLKRREDFIKKASGSVVAIYARMRPDAAAQGLAAIDQETAASVLANLNPRTASAILNEMEPARAAQLTKAIAGPLETAAVEEVPK